MHININIWISFPVALHTMNKIDGHDFANENVKCIFREKLNIWNIFYGDKDAHIHL